jgi:membrane-associated phospholipid phosphatase
VSAVESFDDWADAQLERLRGNVIADSVFKSASFLGDFSGIWHLIGVGRAIVDPSVLRQSVAMSALIGVESLIVNQGLKRLFHRTRPTESGDPRYPVRHPSTSSFPSGHASAAFFAASILTTATGRSLAPVWYSTAVIVAVSRAYVRIHHPSDVVGGAAVGAALGVVGSKVFTAWVL